MVKVFLDSSVLFSAIYSNKGYARDLIVLAEQRKISLIISKYALEEVEKNLRNKASDLLNLLKQFTKIVPIHIVKNPPKKLVERVTLFVHPKDAPVVAAAIDQKVDYLVSFDQKDLVNNDQVKQQSIVKIVFPKEVVALFLS